MEEIKEKVNENEEVNMDHIKLSMPNKPEYVSIIRLTASAIASRIGFNIDDIEDIKVAIGEACTNAIRHGCNKINDTYDIDFFAYEDKLEIKIKDTGKGLCSLNIKEPKAEDLKEGGLGLFIIKTLMDDVKFTTLQNKGTIILMTKMLGVE
ncbi:ATP-binding protein [Clostridium sp. D2Q-14]|uniref:ATP-binding protein n=1 Tax=Anaeromonas gelatinilytica TaxID=2683194 RepID=UPI00193B7DDA|nr:ATP-binding protein [Anaeromonas gelatinilytica]MBS4534938.1 ATP-binding protein [Anaeromonas gelatinilytica]